MKTVLILGGAGYIGSHMLKTLHRYGAQPVTLDSLVTGHRNAVRYGELVEGDLADRTLLQDLFSKRRFDAVMHFASFIQVSESVEDPAKYYRNNVVNTQNLLDAMLANGVRRFIFSSSAAVFGEPAYTPIDEDHACAPLSPYGRSKWMVEQLLRDYSHAYGLRSVSLRYFNAAGADPDGELGERHEPETHLIPRVLNAAAGRQDDVTVFGDDYPTPDGTCIRDYIHVSDLCEAHWLALRWLHAGGAGSEAFNLGNGNGYSVREVIDTAIDVTGKDIATRIAARRAGDPARLVADATRAHKVLGWKPRHGALEQIVADAWQWVRRAG